MTRWPCWHNLAKAKGPGIVTGRYGTIGVFYLIDTDYWPLNTSLYSIDLHGNVPHYLCYMLHSLADLFLLNSAKSAVPGVDRNDLHAITVAVPPVQEQNEIAAILDRETAKIDALVAKEQRLIELLQEQRTALISHAVTKGLNGLGDSAKRYTEMWTETRLGRAIKLQRGFDITGAADGMGDIPVISSGGFSGQCSIPIVRGPGVIVGRKGTLGTVHFCEGDFWPHDITLWVREFGGNHPRFVYYFLLHMRLESYDVGAANPTLNRNHVHPLIVRWPDVESQRRIAEYLDRASGTVDPLIAKVNETISRLREYRTALISAAVTGKIDVRGEAE
ncbi:MAG: restriction endonuclease subunit S [Isosphaeraceae bacterium]